MACSVEPDCPYSAPRLYHGLLDRGARGWPLSVVIDDFSAEALDEALVTGPYGRYVYACDNDVVDHQVVALEFPGATTGAITTGTFTMTAFTEAAHRRTRLFGTRAELAGDGETIRVYDFLTRTERTVAGQPPRRLRRRTSAAERHGRKH